jgi:ribosomal-protein-alanine N-acetyltransferase
LHSFETAFCQAELGCMLASSHWGRGLMGEALTCLMEYAGQLGIATLLADIESDNLPSQRLFRRLDFVWLRDTYYQRRLADVITGCRG